ncbi:MAG TPA: hypothetical protein VK708_13400 [Bryobacteraceae bacterium]|nr:hypothetical protein [Bryobacteraceae bacterium]
MDYNRLVLAALLLAAVQLLEAQTIFNPAPSRIVGQAVLQQQGVLTAIAPNLVEGREFNDPQAVALDASVTPPILYVADFGNNRVLAWKNASSFTNGAYADLVIGQRDLRSTSPEGPGGDLSTGLSSPVGLAVDARGNLYVMDAGDNRVLRYPAPFAQTSDLLVVDLIIGQPDLNGKSSNGGQNAPSANTLALGNGGGVFRAGLAFDAQGNLWMSDPGNNRVLRYPAAVLHAGAGNQPAADLVLGQNDFSSTSLPANITRGGKNYLSQPAGLAFDPQGRLFIADNSNRVVVYAPPFAIGQAVARVMGVVTTPNAPSVSESTLGAVDSSGHAVPPQGVFFAGSNPYVVDTGNARILGYSPFEQWPIESAAFSPPAISVIGQSNFQSAQSNQGYAQPTQATFAGPQPNPFVGGPVSAVFDGTGNLYVADSGNHRVLAFPRQPSGTFTSAARVLGQSDFPYNSLNRIDGREVGFSGNTGSCSLNGALPFALGGSAVIDRASSPPHLYVADPLNNRVLGYLDYRKVKADVTADLVIGQPDLATALVNYPNNNPTQANAQGLWSPQGLAVDAQGNLYIADTCNARVLRFAVPFEQSGAGLPQANLVLGQTSLVGQPIKDISAQTMSSTYGLAFTATGDLVVSDPLANRVLYFKKTATGDFQSGEAASNVFGQPDFSSSLANVLAGPHLISLDSDDELYVADTGNNRIAVLPSVPSAGNNPAVLFSIASLSHPYGVFVDPSSGAIWVTNTGGNQVLQYASGVAVIENAAPSATLSVFGPVSVATDPFGNPVIAEGGANRVGFYYPAIDYTTSAGGIPGQLSGNAANFFGRFAPGMLATIFSFPSAPFAAADVQVSVGGTPAPLLFASPGQINFQVPAATPVGGLEEIQVARVSSGQVLASWLFQMDAESPGLFTVDGSGSGQVVASNQDGSANNGANPAKAGSTVTLYATGQGVVSGMPPDGQGAQGIASTPELPQVFINAGFVPSSDVQWSGLAPGFAGLWQINVKVPSDAPPGDVIVFIIYGGVNSILDPNGIRRTTTIRTTP